MTQVSKRNNWSTSLSLKVSVWPHGTPLFSPSTREAETGGLRLKPPGLQSKVLSQTARMALGNTVYRRGNQQRTDVLVLEGWRHEYWGNVRSLQASCSVLQQRSELPESVRRAYETWYLLYSKDGNLLPLPTYWLGFQVCIITTKQVGFSEVTNLIIMNAKPVTIGLKGIWLALTSMKYEHNTLRLWLRPRSARLEEGLFLGLGLGLVRTPPSAVGPQILLPSPQV